MENLYKHLCKKMGSLLGYKFLSMLHQKTEALETQNISAIYFL